MLANVYKGKITTIEDQPRDEQNLETTATVLPLTGDGIQTWPIVIPWHLRGKMGNLEPGVEVIYCYFEDFTGLILGRLDGEWTGDIYGSIIRHGGKEDDMTLTDRIRSEGNALTVVANSHMVTSGG